MTPEEAIVKGLGAYMKDIASHLRVSDPMYISEAAEHAKGHIADEPYCTMVLLRLEARGIAARKGKFIEEGYIRGPNWMTAAHMYKWDMDSAGDGELTRQRALPDVTLKELFGEEKDEEK